MTARKQPTRGLPVLALSAALWGTVPVAAEGIYRLAETNPLSVGFFRLALSLLILVPTSLVSVPAGQWRVPRRDLLRLLLFGAGMALYQVCYFAAIPRVGVTIAALVTLCTAPVMVALLAALFLGESLSRRVLLAMAGAISGTVLLVGVRPPQAGGSQQLLGGVLLALGAAFGFALVVLITRFLTWRYHALQLITTGMGSGALLLLPFALGTGLALSYPPAGWALLLYLGLVPTALGYILFFYGLRFTPATVASIVNLLEPLASTVLAWYLFQERLGPTGLLGAALLLLAMFVLYWRPSQRPPTKNPHTV
jgi:DME family drug/metabolite transporter